MRRSGIFLLACSLALAGISGVTAGWLSSTARDAMVEQVMRAEAIAASERAAQIGAALDAARSRLVVGAALPAADRAVSNRDVAALAPALLEASRGAGVVRISVTRGDEVLITLPDGSLPRPPTDFAVSTAIPSDPRIVVSAPVRDASGAVVGAINQELSLPRLVPQLVQPFGSNNGATTLAASDGRVLVSTADTPATRLTAPALLAFVGAGTAGTTSYHSSILGADRIAAAAPVAGYPWTVVVDADASAAGTPAGELARRLQGGFAAAMALAALVLGAVAFYVTKTRRGLQQATMLAEKAALRDGLTGLWNRRALDDLVGRLRRGSASVGAILLDVNKLKEINDSYGHAVGDEALRLAASAVRRAVRPDEWAFRYGGDEFIVLFEDLTEEQLASIAERIQASVQEHDVLGLCRLTVAMGLAVGPGASIDEVLRSADARMYADKAGRQASPSPVPSAS